MQKLESIQNETPEFRAVSQEERERRAIVLSGILSQLQNTSPDSKLTASEAGIRAAEALEFFLTEKVDGIKQEPKPLKPKSHRSRSK